MCLYCKSKSTFKPSPRIHGRPPRIFVICTSCGKEVQAAKNAYGEVKEIPSRKKVSTEYALTVHIRLRLSPKEAVKFQRTGEAARDVFLRGLNS